MLPTWILVLVALLIAGVAFGIAQVWPGAGMFFVIPAVFLWMGYARHRARSA